MPSDHGSTANRHAVLRQPGSEYVLLDGDVPQVGPTQALVRLTHSGCCYTDTRSRFAEPNDTQASPRVGGHEGIGIVLALGENVTTPNIEVDSRVGMGFLSQTCRTCELCLGGDEAYCAKQVSTGFKCDGTFQQYALFEANYLISIPEGLDSASTAPLMCAGATVYSALKSARIQAGQSVVISGSGGGLGHIAIQFCKAMRGRVIGIDSGNKRDISLKCGAEHFIDYQTEETTQVVKDLTDGGCHLVTAWEYVRTKGTVICLAMGKTESDTGLAVIKGLRVIGSSTSSRKELIEALDLAADAGIRAMVEIRKLEDVERTMWDLKNGQVAGRVVIDLWA